MRKATYQSSALGPKVNALERAENAKAIFYGMLLYYVFYYTQIGARITALAPLRLEFLTGSFVIFLTCIKILKGEVAFSENRLNYDTVIFFITCGISVPLAVVKTRAFDMNVQYLKFFSIYLMIIACINDEKRLRIFINLHLALIALLFVQPFFLSLQGKGFVYNNHMLRLGGVTSYFGHPNQLGGIVSTNLPLFYFMIPQQKSKIGKILLLVLMAIAIWVIMLTQSRTAFVGVFVFGGLVWLFSKKKAALAMVMIVLSLVVWQFVPQQTKERLLTLGRSVEVISSNWGVTEDGDQPDAEVSSMNS